MTPPPQPVLLGVVCDFRDEGWPSMDLCADQLLAGLAATPGVAAADLATHFRCLFTRLPILGRHRVGFHPDRLLNRHLTLPRSLHRAAADFDLFHIVDHTYAHVVNDLPPDRAGVFCHDLDAFRCLLDPAAEPRPWWFRQLARRTLTGLQKAAVVFHSTEQVRQQILRRGLVDPARLVCAPYGVAGEFSLSGEAGAIDRMPDGPFLLHVGGNVPRKRLDVLLDVFAAIRSKHPGLRLVQVGGPWPDPLAEQIGRLGVGASVTQVRGLSRSDLATLYRRAAAVLIPSEAEGFGLPVIEALACGAAVIASDVPALREAGGPATIYAPVGDVGAWADAVMKLLADPAAAPPREERLAWAARFTWAAHAETIARAYLRLLGG